MVASKYNNVICMTVLRALVLGSGYTGYSVCAPNTGATEREGIVKRIFSYWYRRPTALVVLEYSGIRENLFPSLHCVRKVSSYL